MEREREGLGRKNGENRMEGERRVGQKERRE